MIETNIQVKLDHFDGPLGLLLHLIQKEEMSITDLDINKITNQYLTYLNKLKEVNFDIAGEYLFLAASLLFIKSKSITEDEEQKIRIENPNNLEITTKTQLIQKLEELAKFQRLGNMIMALPKRNEDIFVKPKMDRKAIQNSILNPMELGSLTEVMLDLIRREKRKYTVVKRDRLSIKEKLIELKNSLPIGSKTTMDKLINWEKGKDEVVITFISLLELARLNKLDIFQNEQDATIYVEVKDNLEAFDVETADGFEPEDDGIDKVDTEGLIVSGNSTNQILTDKFDDNTVVHTQQ
jgi:segregation and condensation protein A